MKMTKRHWIGIAVGAAVLLADIIFLMGDKRFFFLIGIAALIAIAPFVATVMLERGRANEKEEMFLEFARSLVGSVKAGTPISRSIIQLRNKNYGSLTPHIEKLANQIALGIPFRQALGIFGYDINNTVISKSIALIIEAEESGGQIDLILESTAKSISEIEDVKKEQRTAMYNFIIEGYIIFFIFLVIMLLVQIKFLPEMMGTIQQAGVSGGGGLGFGIGASTQIATATLNNVFLVLILVQGFFAGLVVGKLAEGKISAGLKHSLIIISLAYLITTGVRIIV